MNSPKNRLPSHGAAFNTLLTIARQMVQDSPDSYAENFDAFEWLETWVNQPVPALGWVAPASLIVTQDGLELVSNLLKSMETGAYW